ncbi:MAG: PAS domain S-box protein [Myxococcota bacterium]
MSLLIPLFAVLISAAFAAVGFAWRSDRRAAETMIALFLCTGFWGGVELLTAMATSPAEAIGWLRWAPLPALLLGPVTMSLLADMLPQVRSSLSRAIRAGYFFACVAGLTAGLSPGAIESVTQTPLGGWMPEYGWLLKGLIPVGFILPFLAACEALRSAPSRAEGVDSGAEQRVQRRARLSARVLSVVVAISLSAAFLTELVFPVLAIPSPRMGALFVATAAALAWLGVLYASDDLGATSHGLARAMLAKLQDGVVLIQLDGAIVSANPRFQEMAGVPFRELAGAQLEEWVDLSAEALCTGFKDREVSMRRVGEEALPVSLSSTLTSDPAGGVTGAVIVFRDLREIESLRRSLLSSGRLAAIGELAAGIAHEVNNPVAFVRSDLNMLSSRMEEINASIQDAAKLDSTEAIFSRGQQRIERAHAATEFVAQVVGDVRGFAHLGGPGQGGSEPVLLLEVALRLARLQRGGEVELEILRAESCERIEYGQELKQILLSLLRSLSEAAAEGGRIETALSNTADALLIEISCDPVVGPAAAVVERFEVASAASEESEESHLELAIAVGLVLELGGAIQVDATAEHRVEVVISLPLSSEAAG